MNWYEKQPMKTRDFIALTKTYDKKYGDYDYTKDSRALDRTFKQTLLAAVGNLNRMKVLVCGANSGYEINILQKKFPSAQFVAIDISLAALTKLPPNVSRVHASMDNLLFKNGAFDVYINCRSIQSSGVNFKKAIAEAQRVTKGKIIISIPNGYLVRGEIVNGMYDYSVKNIDKKKPEVFVRKIKSYLKVKKERKSEAELFLIA